MMALLENPDQLQRVRDDPGLIDAAVQETLRYDSPVQTVARRVTQDTEIGGRRLRAGQYVLPFLGAANRDPSVYRQADRFDIGRREKNHMSFGQGIPLLPGFLSGSPGRSRGLRRAAQPLSLHPPGVPAPTPGAIRAPRLPGVVGRGQRAICRWVRWRG